MTTPYAVGTQFLIKSYDNTGIPEGYILTVQRVTETVEGGFEYDEGASGYGIDHDWVEAGFVEAV